MQDLIQLGHYLTSLWIASPYSFRTLPRPVCIDFPSEIGPNPKLPYQMPTIPKPDYKIRGLPANDMHGKKRRRDAEPEGEDFAHDSGSFEALDQLPLQKQDVQHWLEDQAPLAKSRRTSY